MHFDPEEHHRRSVRKLGYDYSSAGAYFVTICTQGKSCLLGQIHEATVHLSHTGRIVKKCWDTLPAWFPYVRLDAFVIMPTHLHGIIWIIGRGEASVSEDLICCEPADLSYEQYASLYTVADASPLQPACGTKPGSLASVIQTFKANCTRRVNRVCNHPGRPLWQRNYYEHIIRSQKSLEAIREYIEANPANWLLDADNPDNPRS